MENLELNFVRELDFGIEHEVNEIDPSIELAHDILTRVMKYRRVLANEVVCSPSCRSCHSPHLSKIITAIRENKPVEFALPAFPGKSPNLSKVFGPLPDMAELLALQSLNQLCEEIKSIYSPGAKMILCSDGRVFNDIVGMRETDVTAYQNELSLMIDELQLKHLLTFNLDEFAKGNDFTNARLNLMEKYGMPKVELREKVLRGSKGLGSSEEVGAHRMYCGMTRFLVEDSHYPGQLKSRASIQKECKAKAYEVIRRSNAWSELIEVYFPDAVRLSIHPHACGSKKLGIRLIGAENWMTPWHGVAVKTQNGFILMKHAEAYAQGFNLVFAPSGRASHFEMNAGY
jgi:pyoverdine/dityrosine biosynthesis protein Dit1